MEPYIKKAAIVAEIDDMLNTKEHTSHCDEDSFNSGRWKALTKIKGFLNTLEVIDPYEQCIQYPTVKDGIKAHAEVYSFNIESELFNQLTKEQQELWRNEIEQAVISGGEAGVELARDPRYKENLEAKEVEEETESIWHDANQQPTMYRKYLVRYSDGRVSGSWERHDSGFIPWEDVIKEHGFTHWCYVEDLIKL